MNRENGQACICVLHYGMGTQLAENVQGLQARAREGAIFILFPQAGHVLTWCQGDQGWERGRR